MLRSFPFSLSLISAALLSFATPAPAQETSPTEQLIDSLGRYCNRATEVTYSSLTLSSSDGTTQVRVEGLLRKLIEDESEARRSGDLNYCYGSSIETLSTQLVIADQRLELLEEPVDVAYLLLEPLSLSSDSRYLVTKTYAILGGLYTSEAVAFFDLEAGEGLPAPDYCERADRGSVDATFYEGFSAPSTVVVRCSSFNPRVAESRAEWYESVELTTGTIQVLSNKPDDLQSYGTMSGELETDVQAFPF